jgi:hypothetical protein
MQLQQGIWRKSRRAFEVSGRAGEVACCDGMCCCPVFGKVQIQPLVALLPTNPLTSLQSIILSGVGEVENPADVKLLRKVSLRQRPAW